MLMVLTKMTMRRKRKRPHLEKMTKLSSVVIISLLSQCYTGQFIACPMPSWIDFPAGESNTVCGAPCVELTSTKLDFIAIHHLCCIRQYPQEQDWLTSSCSTSIHSSVSPNYTWSLTVSLNTTIYISWLIEVSSHTSCAPDSGLDRNPCCRIFDPTSTTGSPNTRHLALHNVSPLQLRELLGWRWFKKKLAVVEGLQKGNMLHRVLYTQVHVNGCKKKNLLGTPVQEQLPG